MPRATRERLPHPSSQSLRGNRPDVPCTAPKCKCLFMHKGAYRQHAEATGHWRYVLPNDTWHQMNDLEKELALNRVADSEHQRIFFDYP